MTTSSETQGYINADDAIFSNSSDAIVSVYTLHQGAGEFTRLIIFARAKWILSLLEARREVKTTHYFTRFSVSFLFYIFGTIELIAYLEPSKAVRHNQMLTSFEFLDSLKVFKDVKLQIRMEFTQVYPDHNILVFLFELQNWPWPAGFNSFFNRSWPKRQ